MDVQEDVFCKLNCETDNVSEKSSAYLAVFSAGSVVKDDVKKIQFRGYENSKTPDGLDRKRIRKILVADAGKLQYSGQNYGTQASQRTESNRYYIGVRNKKTDVMTIHSIQLVHCTPVLNTTVFDQEDNDIEEKTYTEKVDSLTKAFGSKKKRQAMESRLSYSKGNADGGSAIVDSVDVSDLKQHDDTETAAASSQTAQAIPPQNTSATMPDNVYDVKDIISVEEYFALEPLAKLLIEATPVQIQEWKENSVYGQLVLQVLQVSKSSVDLNKAKLLVYYNFLIRLLKLTANDVRKKDPLPDVPEPFKRKLLDRFTFSGSNVHGGRSRTMPASMKDKAITYAMVLALFVEDFRIELPVLQLDFKKAAGTVTKIANALGCHIINQKKNNVAVKIAELKLPLYVPSVKQFGRKK